MALAISSCRAPNAKWNVPAQMPSCCGLNAKSASNCLAIMAVTVRKAWLRANALASAMSIAQLLRESGCCSCMGAYGATWADHSHRRVCLLENN
jgi:hypothetical protein